MFDMTEMITGIIEKFLNDVKKKIREIPE